MCPDKNTFPIAHIVTFYYYTGCKEIFEGKFNDGWLNHVLFITITALRYCIKCLDQ